MMHRRALVSLLALSALLGCEGELGTRGADASTADAAPSPQPDAQVVTPEAGFVVERTALVDALDAGRASDGAGAARLA